MHTRTFLTCFVFLIYLFPGCSEKEIVAPSTQMIEYSKVRSLGCQPRDMLAKTSNYSTVECDYVDGVLTISTLFSTYCSAMINDSIATTENSIDICLRDINPGTAKCTCQFKKVFTFNAEAPKTIQVTLYFKSNKSDRYQRLVGGTLKI